VELKSIKKYSFKIKNNIISDSTNNFEALNLDGTDFSKPGVVIIDDNAGICSFIEDDFEELDENGLINLDDYNIFNFNGNMCAYKLFATLQKYPNMNIQKAIIDITYSGTVQTNKGNIKLNGVDVFEVLYELNPNLKYVFYTGNQLNKNIKTISTLINKYNDILKKNIFDNVLYKTNLSMKDRRNYFLRKLFNDNR